MESAAQNPLKGYVHTMQRQQYEDNKEPPRSPMCAMCSTPYPEARGNLMITTTGTLRSPPRLPGLAFLVEVRVRVRVGVSLGVGLVAGL